LSGVSRDGRRGGEIVTSFKVQAPHGRGKTKGEKKDALVAYHGVKTPRERRRRKKKKKKKPRRKSKTQGMSRRKVASNLKSYVSWLRSQAGGISFIHARTSYRGKREVKRSNR